MFLRKFSIGRVALGVVSFSFLASISACSAGEQAESCTIEDDDGVASLVCPDGTRAVIGGEGGSKGSGTTNDGDTTGDMASTVDPSDLLAGVDLCDIQDNGDGTSTVGCLGDVSFLVENEPVAATVLRTTTLLPGADCPSGGLQIEVGSDENGNAKLDDDEVTQKQLNCDATVIVGDVGVTTRAELQALYGVQAIVGNLYIWNDDTTDLKNVHDLEYLTSLEVVTGEVSISSLPIESLAGLDSLRSVGSLPKAVNTDAELFVSGFSLSYMEDLISLDGAPKLQSVDGLALVGNSGLTDLSGLENLTSIDALNVDNCASLRSLTGLDAVEIPGNIWLQRLDGLDSLVGLENLKKIGGDLLVDQVPLTSLVGLSALETIGGQLDLRNLDLLSSLSGMPQLSEFGGLNLLQLPLLSSTVGLPNMKELRGNLSFRWMDELSTLDGLSELTTVGGEVNFVSLPKLASLSLLQNLRVVGGPLVIAYNDGLLSLDGLNALTQASSLDLDGQALITSLSGLENLKSLPAGLSISNHAELANLHALSSLQTVGGTFTITSNAKLPTCEVEWLIDNVKTLKVSPDVSNNFDAGICQ